MIHLKIIIKAILPEIDRDFVPRKNLFVKFLYNRTSSWFLQWLFIHIRHKRNRYLSKRIWLAIMQECITEN